MNFQISYYLDTRRNSKSKLYPLRLRVWSYRDDCAKLYWTKYKFTQKDFEKIWKSEKPRNEFQEKQLDLQHHLDSVTKIAQDINPFTFDAFEARLFDKNVEVTDVFSFYKTVEKKLESNKQYSTVCTYADSRKSLQTFWAKNNKENKDVPLPFIKVTSSFLNEYEAYMLNRGRSRTTISIYLRVLRAIFNLAIHQKLIADDIYPFGKYKYKIPKQRKIKKALNKEELKRLFEAPAQNAEQQKAKDFWFFSYACNGMNMKDIALLKFKDIQTEKFTFFRAKTITTSKEDLREIQVYLNDFSKEILSKYANKDTSADNYVFPILNKDLEPNDAFKKIKNFTSSINKNMKKLAKKHGLPQVSTYWARHSFATMIIRNGGSIELAQETLGHSDPRTTKNYFAGFEDDTKKELLKSVMNFS